MAHSVFPWRMTARRASWALWLGVCLIACGLTGCSLGVMAGKAIFGEPKTPAEFRTRTGVDLTKSEKTLLVIVQTPQSMEAERPSLEMDLIEAISKRMKLHGICVVDPDEVARWIDNNGGRFEHPTELTRDFNADYIAIVDLDTFVFHEDNSPTLYQGKAHGAMQVYEVQSLADSKQALQVFAASFRHQYPPHGPIPVDQVSPRMFQQRFIDNLAERLGSRFYDYRIGDEM